jgi:sugar-specific transcriptional regulator TrmB
MLYYVLNQLIQRGLVSMSKEASKTMYIAEDPQRLYDLLNDKEKAFAKHTANIRTLIPELRRHYRLSNVRPAVRTADGVEAYMKLLEEILESKPKEILAYEPSASKKTMGSILKKVLLPNNSVSLKALTKRPYDDYTEYRSHLAADTIVDLMLIDGKLLYTTLYDNHEPSAILIEDRALYAHQRSLFDAQWKQGKDLTLTQKLQ